MISKKIFLDQHGCAKNQVDGEILVSRLQKLGMTLTSNPNEADLILINTCGFIESAKTESINSLLQARVSYPNAKILLAGCLAERYAKEFEKELPEADGIFGNGDLNKIDDVVESLFKNERPVLTPEQKGVCCGERTVSLSFPGSSFVKITEGCDNRCSFCAIPIIRGTLRSRKSSEIVAEIKKLIQNNVHEINLIGQDLAAYGCGKEDDVFGEGSNFYREMYVNAKNPVIQDEFFKKNHSPLFRLCKMISEIQGDFWVRLLYIHPDHFNPDILDLMQEDKRFLPYFDIPFQSGDSEIIKKMNRKGSAQTYKEILSLIRKKIPESCIRTTFLTGFPGESEENAKNTQEFLKEIRSDWSGCFSYSAEDDTVAAKMKNKVKAKLAQERAQKLEEMQSQITAENLKSRINKIYDVLIEEIIENKQGTDEGLAIGRAWFEAPEVDGSFVIRYDLDDKLAVKNILPGKIVKVKALASSAVDIDGEYIAS